MYYSYIPRRLTKPQWAMNGIIIDNAVRAVLHVASNRLAADSENNQLAIITSLLHRAHKVLSQKCFRIIARPKEPRFTRRFVEHDALPRPRTFRASFVAKLEKHCPRNLFPGIKTADVMPWRSH